MCVFFDELSSGARVSDDQEMLDSLFDQPMSDEPVARTAMKCRDIFSTDLRTETSLQQATKQMVIAVPVAAIVERHDEEIGLFDTENKTEDMYLRP